MDLSLLYTAMHTTPLSVVRSHVHLSRLTRPTNTFLGHPYPHTHLTFFWSYVHLSPLIFIPTNTHLSVIQQLTTILVEHLVPRTPLSVSSHAHIHLSQFEDPHMHFYWSFDPHTHMQVLFGGLYLRVDKIASEHPLLTHIFI
jgi:hypothetical protein